MQNSIEQTKLDIEKFFAIAIDDTIFFLRLYDAHQKDRLKKTLQEYFLLEMKEKKENEKLLLQNSQPLPAVILEEELDNYSEFLKKLFIEYEKYFVAAKDEALAIVEKVFEKATPAEKETAREVVHQIYSPKNMTEMLLKKPADVVKKADVLLARKDLHEFARQHIETFKKDLETHNQTTNQQPEKMSSKEKQNNAVEEFKRQFNLNFATEFFGAVQARMPMQENEARAQMFSSAYSKLGVEVNSRLLARLISLQTQNAYHAIDSHQFVMSSYNFFQPNNNSGRVTPEERYDREYFLPSLLG